MGEPGPAEVSARRLAGQMACVLQGSLLVRLPRPRSPTCSARPASSSYDGTFGALEGGDLVSRRGRATPWSESAGLVLSAPRSDRDLCRPGHSVVPPTADGHLRRLGWLLRRPRGRTVRLSGPAVGRRSAHRASSARRRAARRRARGRAGRGRDHRPSPRSGRWPPSCRRSLGPGLGHEAVDADWARPPDQVGRWDWRPARVAEPGAGDAGRTLGRDHHEDQQRGSALPGSAGHPSRRR